MKRVLLSLSLLLISLLAISAGLHYKGSLGAYLLFGALALNVLLIYAVDRVLAKHYS
jgi:hypothetical protein